MDHSSENNYQWSVVISRKDSDELQTISGKEAFHTKGNAQLFAERYVLDYIALVDGINRLDAALPARSSPMPGVEVSRKYVKKIEQDQTVDQLCLHYIVGNLSGTPWGLTVHRTHIFTRPLVITSVAEEIKEVEVEEEREITKEITLVTPGWFRNGYEKKTVIETVPGKIKKQILEQKMVETHTLERIVKSDDLFTVSVLSTKNEQYVFIPEDLPKEMKVQFAQDFAETETCKSLWEASQIQSSCSLPYLMVAHEDEFGRYDPAACTIPWEEKFVERQSSPINIYPALKTTKPSSGINLSHSIANLGAEMMKKRKEILHLLSGDD